MTALLSFFPLFGRLKGRLLLTLILSLATLAAAIGLLGVSGWFLTAAALSTAGSAFGLFAPSAGVRGLSFVRILSRYAEKLSGHDATLALLSDLRQWLFARLFPLAPLGARFGRGDLVSRLLADVDALDTMFLVALGPITSAMLVGIGMTVLLSVLLPGAVLPYALAYLAAALIVSVALVASSRRPAADAARASSALRSRILDCVDGQQDLVLLGQIDRAVAQVRRDAEALARPRMCLGALAALAGGVVQALLAAALLGTLIAGLEALRRGATDGPVLAGLVLAVVASFEASAVLIRSAGRLGASASAAERLKAISELAPLVRDPEHPHELARSMAISLENVSFGYDPDRPVLRQIDLKIAEGEHVALLGPSGSGKSTLAQLLVRLGDPQTGTVRLGGVNVLDLSRAELRRNVVLMTQDAPVFLDTLRDNLRVGRLDASDAQLWTVLDQVHLGEWARGLPDGLDTMLGEMGRTVSAGQARRLCLARTLLSPGSVIVLDEPTSGLDPETECAFFADLPAVLEGRTAVVITHARASQGFDRVLTMEAGTLRDRPPATSQIDRPRAAASGRLGRS